MSKVVNVGNEAGRAISPPVRMPQLAGARMTVYMALGISAVVQVFLDASAENILCAVLVFGVSSLTVRLLVVRSVILAAPLAVVSVLGFNVATMSGALLAQTCSLRPLIFNLRVPEVTFSACAAFQMSLLGALFIFRHAKLPRQISKTINRRIVKPLGLMKMPSRAELWVMGSVGSAAMAWTATVMYTGTVQYGDAGSKLAFGFTFLAYAPYLIPLRRAFGGVNDKVSAKDIALLGAYTVLLIIIGILRNSRGAFAVGVSNLGISLLLATAIGQVVVSREMRRRIVVAVFAVLVAAPTLTDISTAMVMVRGQRSDLTPAQLLSRTLDIFQDKNELQEYRSSSVVLSKDSDYDETYMSNPFAARFVATKFFDNTLSYGWIWHDSYRSIIRDVTLEKLVALLPTPVLSAFGVRLNKSELEFSIGDYLYYLHSGVGLGGYKTGSSVAHSIALFGGFAFFAVVPVYLIGFIVLHGLTERSRAGVRVSPMILMKIMLTVYFFACSESLLLPIALPLRELPENTAIYIVVFWVARLLVPKFRNYQRSSFLSSASART